MEMQVKELILKNKKRTFEMFADSNHEAELGDECVKLKIQKQYENIGKVPGVKLQEGQRLRVLRDIGVEGVDRTDRVKYLDIKNNTIEDLKHSLLNTDPTKQLTGGSTLLAIKNKSETQNPVERPKIQEPQKNNMQLSLLTALNQN